MVSVEPPSYGQLAIKIVFVVAPVVFARSPNPMRPAAEEVRTAGQLGSTSHDMDLANLANKPQPR